MNNLNALPAPRRPSTGRPVSKYCAKKLPKKYKNVMGDYSERKTAIDHYDLHGMQSTLGAMYDRLTSTARETKRIYSWMSNPSHIEKIASSPTTAKMKCRRAAGTGTTLTKKAEEQLVQWVQAMRNDGVPVTTHMCVMALEAAIDLVFNDVEFRAGWHWMDGFKRSHGLSLRTCTRIRQQTPEDGLAVLGIFSAPVRKIVEDENIDVVYNADQTAVNYEYLPTKTLNKTRPRCVCGGKTKDRMTAMFLADTTGAKHPLFLFLQTTKSTVKVVVQENLTQRQGFGNRLWESVDPLQVKNDCRIFGNPTEWWNSQISLKFLEFHFCQRPDRHTKKVLLIWDDYSPISQTKSWPTQIHLD
ncbi:hypothetical protein DYB37_012918 [Aphanomyces astaci]|uniref:HTH CENPB-type domain-containing protein n=1 Tax=Aphanomyces astaci TaxID=112090 RepID=A0A3R7AB42_APHAT|nr:hypothetical protein DYB35_009371 [Aphanomyces astaci]RHZ05425.1 hypothetical protein DYB37_012918 [Aphanomyces astaci]